MSGGENCLGAYVWGGMSGRCIQMNRTKQRPFLTKKQNIFHIRGTIRALIDMVNLYPCPAFSLLISTADLRNCYEVNTAELLR